MRSVERVTTLRLWPLLGVLCLLLGSAAVTGMAAETIMVTTTAELRAALRAAKPGHRILLAPGEYKAEMIYSHLQGTAEEPIVIAGESPLDCPVIKGGGTGLQLQSPAHVELRDLIVDGAKLNGLNIDDGGNHEKPGHHVTFRNLTIRNVGSGGNDDCLKITGINDFVVEDCTMDGWGREGQAIDVMGCERGIIRDCVFDGRRHSKVGLQIKAGSSDIRVERCAFRGIGDRGAQLGGKSGVDTFRPEFRGYEAKNIVVEDCTFDGSEAPIAFVGVDGAVVRRNVIFRPQGWVFRILQESQEGQFIPCRRGEFLDNVIVWHSAEIIAFVNVKVGTQPETFRIAGNYWYCVNKPSRSEPLGLPVPEQDGVYGINPYLANPYMGDFRLMTDRESMRDAYTQSAVRARSQPPLAVTVVFLILGACALAASQITPRLMPADKPRYSAYRMSPNRRRSVPPPNQLHFLAAAVGWTAIVALSSLSGLKLSDWSLAESLDELMGQSAATPTIGSPPLAALLAFVPLGFCGYAAMTVDRSDFRRQLLIGGAIVFVSALFLSVFLELMQYAVVGVETSRTDVFAHILGTCAGMMLWYRYGQQSVQWLRLRTSSWRPLQPLDLTLVAYAFSLAIYSCWPFHFIASPVDVYNAFYSGMIQLVPFARPEPSWLLLAGHAALFLPVGALAVVLGTTHERPMRKLPMSLLVSVAAVVMIQSVRLMVVGRIFDTTYVIMGAMGAVAGVFLMRYWMVSNPLWSPLATTNPSLKTARMFASAAVYAWLAAGLYLALQFE